MAVPVLPTAVCPFDQAGPLALRRGPTDKDKLNTILTDARVPEGLCDLVRASGTALRCTHSVARAAA
ncbi:unnamed protein product, partial [Effrenium voratum]